MYMVVKLTSVPSLRCHFDVNTLCWTTTYSGIKATAMIKIKVGNRVVCKKKNPSWMFGANRKSVPRDHCSASLVKAQ